MDTRPSTGSGRAEYTRRMRILVVADVHANLAALQAVLAEAGEFETLWSLGDVVGYGAEPGACIELLRRYPLGAVVGHTHVPAVFFESEEAYLHSGASLALAERRFVANPGGVGQPRDGDPRAAYAVLDTEARRIEFRRAAYDIETTQAKIRAAGLPAYLAERLARGR